MTTYTVRGWQRRTYWCEAEIEANSPLEAIHAARVTVDAMGAEYEACGDDNELPYYMTATDEADAETEWLAPRERIEEAGPQLLATLKAIQRCPQAAPWLVRAGIDVARVIAQAEGTELAADAQS